MRDTVDKKKNDTDTHRQISTPASSHHLANHHHVGAQVLVDPKDVQQTDVPIDDVDAVDNATIAHEWRLLQTQDHADGEYEDGH